MPPHGPNVLGATHSHNPQYPDDEWNLYAWLRIKIYIIILYNIYFM